MTAWAARLLPCGGICDAGEPGVQHARVRAVPCGRRPFIALTARQDRCGASQARRHRHVLRAWCGGSAARAGPGRRMNSGARLGGSSPAGGGLQLANRSTCRACYPPAASDPRAAAMRQPARRSSADMTILLLLAGSGHSQLCFGGSAWSDGSTMRLAVDGTAATDRDPDRPVRGGQPVVFAARLLATGEPCAPAAGGDQVLVNPASSWPVTSAGRREMAVLRAAAW
jgi:hypothetical protein